MGGHATYMDVDCPSCEYVGPAPLISVEQSARFDAHWTVVCPACTRAWVVDTLDVVWPV